MALGGCKDPKTNSVERHEAEGDAGPPRATSHCQLEPSLGPLHATALSAATPPSSELRPICDISRDVRCRVCLEILYVPQDVEHIQGIWGKHIRMLTLTPSGACGN